MGTVADIIAVAPPDAAEAIRWLLSNGVTSTRVEPRHGMGFALAELALDEMDVRVVSDRDEWSIDLRRADESWLQFDLIHAVITDEDWSTVASSTNRSTRPVRRHPIGVSWRESLPRAIEWLRATPTAADDVKEAGRRRAKAIFG